MTSNKKSVNVPVSVFVNEPTPNIDFKYGPYSSKKEAIDTLTGWDSICEGLTVGITTNGVTKDYQFQGGIDEAHLVEKNAGGSSSGGDSVTKIETVGDSIVFYNGKGDELFRINKATASSLGLMSATDKGKLDSLAAISGMAANAVVFFENVDTMKEAELADGMVAITRGFYEAGDGGNAIYNIVADSDGSLERSADDISLIGLTNGNYADIQLNDDVDFRQLGAMPSVFLVYSTNTHQDKNYRDCHDNFMAYINLCKRRGYIYRLVMPAGHFYTSPAFMVIGNGRGVRICGAAADDYDHLSATYVHSLTKRQQYIWCVSGQKEILSKNSTFYACDGVDIRNIYFDGLHGQKMETADFFTPLTGLVAVGLANSYFDNIRFHVCTCGMLLNKVQEVRFGSVYLTRVGGFHKGILMHGIWFANLEGNDGAARTVFGRTDEDYSTQGYSGCKRNGSANWFGYINAEALGGSIIHADNGADFTHSEIGNIQWEGSFRSPSFGIYTEVTPNTGVYDDYTTAANKTNPDPAKYTKEVTFRTGALTGSPYDVVIHSVSQTGGRKGYWAAHEGSKTFMKILQVAAVVCPSDANLYFNVQLMNFFSRGDLKAFYGQKLSSTPSGDVFTLGTPIDPNSDLIYLNNGMPTPKVTFTKPRTPERIYPGLNNYMMCGYDADAKAPGHLVGYSATTGGSFTFIAKANKHYMARIKMVSNLLVGANDNPNTTDAVYCNVYAMINGSKSYTAYRCRVKNFNTYCIIDLNFGGTVLKDGTEVRIEGGRGVKWDYIYEVDSAPVYSAKAPSGSFVWVGRLWYDTANNILKKCSAVARCPVYLIECKYNIAASMLRNDSQLVLDCGAETITIPFAVADWEGITSNATLATKIASKLRSMGYAAAVSSATSVYVGFIGLNTAGAKTPAILSNTTECTFTRKMLYAGREADAWSAVSTSVSSVEALNIKMLSNEEGGRFEEIDGYITSEYNHGGYYYIKAGVTCLMSDDSSIDMDASTMKYYKLGMKYYDSANPSGIDLIDAIEQDGHLYISNSGAFRIEVTDSKGEVVKSVTIQSKAMSQPIS